MSLLGRGKDRLVSYLAELVVARLPMVCEVKDVSVDSRRKELWVEVLLKGELRPLEVFIRGYAFGEENGKGWLAFENLTTNREWLDIAVAEQFPGRRIELPQGTPAGLIRKVT
jgi:hypothetical protein